MSAIEQLIAKFSPGASEEELVDLLKKIKGLSPEEREATYDKLFQKFVSAIEEAFTRGALAEAWDYVREAVIEFRVDEPILGIRKTVTVSKIGDKTAVTSTPAEHPDAVSILTLEALNYILGSSDYREAGVRLLKCRRYPTELRRLFWKTLIPAIEAYEKTLVLFYRKLGMF